MSLNQKVKGIAVVWLIILGLILIIAGSTYWYYVDVKPYLDKNKVRCTEEAKLCPDGSYVGRTGPNCQFAECPVSNANKLEYYYCPNGIYYTRVPYDDFSITYYDKDGNFLVTCERGRNYTEGKCAELSAVCKKQEGKEVLCISDIDCKEGFSCWYMLPRGPSAGIRGSKENPGKCWSNDLLKRIF